MDGRDPVPGDHPPRSRGRRSGAREGEVRLERGLPFSEVNSVKQDTRGFLWIAAGGGLFRYDGVELRPWPRDSFRSLVRGLAAGPDGEVMFLGYTGTLHEVAGDGIRPVEGPGR